MARVRGNSGLSCIGIRVWLRRLTVEATESNLEIERKFLITDASWQNGSEGVLFAQGYVPNGSCTFRVRRTGIDGGFLTIKTAHSGIRRKEFEYPIPAEDAAYLMASICSGGVVEKYRHCISVGQHVWEIDVFIGANEGLVVAEIELGAEDEAFERPSWLGEEVSHDPRYRNACLAVNPYTTWPKEST